jgi:hypothetical protein
MELKSTSPELLHRVSSFSAKVSVFADKYACFTAVCRTYAKKQIISIKHP